jgi:CelD/BcsL family acetyltransferase involved in cellulose biosynthesis
VIRACLRNGRLRLYCLALGDQIVAIDYGYRFRNTVVSFQGGFDPAHSLLGLGSCLLGYEIEHAIREGNTIFDLLRDEYEYKRKWAASCRQTYYVEAYHADAAALAFRARRVWLPRLKRGIRKLFPPSRQPGAE